METRDSILDYPMSSELDVQEDKIETARINDSQGIEVIDQILITSDTVGRIDLIILKTYGRLDVLPILLDFNNIESITDLRPGDIFYLPSLSQLNDKTILLQPLDEMEVNGIAEHEKESYSAKDAASVVDYMADKNTDADKTFANSKLKVSLNKVTYNPETGIIKF